jgi:heme/copper-type cytochrome/quinol oxidase subunit 4
MITVRDAINRGYNLLGVGIIAISGLSFFSDLPAEINQLSHIVDEVLLAVLALVTFVWYLIGRNKYSRTVVPIVFAVVALAIKVLGLFLEFSDPEDRGDEFGALVLFVVLIIVLVWQYIASRRLAAQAQEMAQVPEAIRVEQLEN